MMLARMQKQDSINTLSNYHLDQQVGRDDLANMIILHEYPLSMVDDLGFRKFCKTISPSFNIISRITIERDIMKMYRDGHKAQTRRGPPRPSPNGQIFPESLGLWAKIGPKISLGIRGQDRSCPGLKINHIYL
ncbi:hypothetical protein Patl1_07151 [Pistacia atlantica]|uniref:Uncharacterized protein n=1 Tax=Pistacia atlantica TaxID=434234 RepID=A0ACC1AKZ1_9ROSI|nr:hypothetical protein Patl1_07151 [Pistacia atlantica]